MLQILFFKKNNFNHSQSIFFSS